MTTETLSREEREFSELKNVKVVFDVGAKNTKYPSIKPKATYHLFEPNPKHFASLPKGDKIIANNYGLGDKEEYREYDDISEAFAGSEALPNEVNGPAYCIRTLDNYVKENKIKRIDFLKIDTEGMDYKVLLGGKEALKMVKTLQYEYWNHPEWFTELLTDFTCKDIGERNILCSRMY